MAEIFSVVIPTYNRSADLEAVLQALENQECPAGWGLEIVVVDDGSSDGTDQVLKNWIGVHRIALHQANAGPAKARNEGVWASSGRLIAFLGDDTIPQDHWLVEHIEMHRIEMYRNMGREQPLAVLGFTSFPPEEETPFLRWINEFGAQFGYSIIEDPSDVPFNFFYTSNISLQRNLFCEHDGFREDFPAAAWEDIEFAYRATRNGMRMVYQPRARTIHCHRIQPRTFCRRQRTAGRSGAIFAGLHPELEDFLGLYRLKGRKRASALKLWALARLVTLGEWLPGVVSTRVYQKLLDENYLDGLAEGLHLSGRG